MDVGIGLPNAVVGTTGRQLVGFARAADEHGFSTLGTLDRLVYPNYDPFIAGCGELIFFPASGDPEQVRLLAEARDG
jgi:hypothetical protein